MTDFHPVDLPVFPSLKSSECYLFLPGFDEDSTEGVEFKVDWDRLLLHVFLYDGAEADDVTGTRITVGLNESNVKAVEEMETLYVIDPRCLSPADVGEEEFVHLKNKFDQWKRTRG